MQFELSVIQLITICAIINGFIFSFLLFKKNENRLANRFLSLLILCMCFTFTPYAIDTMIWLDYRWLAWMPFSLSYWIGPSFYFYVKTLTNPLAKFKSKNLWHFSPIILNYLHSSYHAFIEESNSWSQFHYITEIFEYGAILSILTYMLICYRQIANYRQSLFDNLSNVDMINLGWIGRIIIVITASFFVILIFIIVNVNLNGRESLYQLNQFKSIILLVYTTILYWLSISGFKQAQTIEISTYTESYEGLKNESSLIAHKLESIMISKNLHRSPKLSLSDLSKEVGISERVISEVINNELNKNYYQFVNEYRIDEVKKRLIDPDNDHLKIISLAEDAGFNSKASFNRIFKLYTGITPNQFKSQEKT